jgi:hypothetical protein
MPAPYQQPDLPPRPISRPQWILVAFIIAYTAASILYKVLMHRGLGHSGAMFIGLPAIIAIVLAFAPPARTVTGGIAKGITFALLFLAPLLGEGYLCILIASPIFYFVGVLIGLAIDHSRRRTTTFSCIAVVLLPMCLEGVVPQLTFNRAETVTATRIIDAPADSIERTLAQSPDIRQPLPRFLRIGFPHPLATSGTGLEIGDTRTIHFSGAEGDPPGDLVVRVTERRPGYARLDTVSDSSKLTQWIRWTSSEVEWHPIDATHTRVTWTIHFDRELDPVWYFTPWERFAVSRAAAYMITANATPAGVHE